MPLALCHFQKPKTLFQVQLLESQAVKNCIHKLSNQSLSLEHRC